MTSPELVHDVAMKGIIQIAGVVDQDEAQMLVEAGVDWLGFPLRLTVHQEDISESEAARIISSLSLPTCAIVITYADRAVEIDGLCQKLGAKHVQLHGEVAIEELYSLRSMAPELFVTKSLIVREYNGTGLMDCVRELAPYVDAFIVDTFDPSTGACGATGKTHDWSVSRRLVEVSPHPVILAGGLRPDNVHRAILEVHPAGVDAHTGVESLDGQKDSKLVRAFVTEARRAFCHISI